MVSQLKALVVGAGMWTSVLYGKNGSASSFTRRLANMHSYAGTVDGYTCCTAAVGSGLQLGGRGQGAWCMLHSFIRLEQDFDAILITYMYRIDTIAQN